MGDKAIPNLLLLKNLEILEVCGTRLTKRGINRIKKHLPACKVVFKRD